LFINGLAFEIALAALAFAGVPLDAADFAFETMGFDFGRGALRVAPRAACLPAGRPFFLELDPILCTG